MKNFRVAVVNSKSFGKYSDVEVHLRKICQVVRLSVPKNIKGLQLAEKLRGFEFIIASTTPKYTSEFFENNKDVVLVARHGVGVDNIDVESATKNGVIVTRVPGYMLREAVAENTIALILLSLRKILNASIAVSEGNWSQRARFIGHELNKKIVGIIGLGNIGSRVAQILSEGFKAKILAYDPYCNRESFKKVNAEAVSLDRLLRESDIITVHTPLTEETYHLLGRNEFMRMKKGVIIVNTARGELIDTTALIEAIRNNKVSAVALDTVEGEPISKDHPLLKYRDKVVITPHISGYTFEALVNMDKAVVKAIEAVIQHKKPEVIVNEEVYKRVANL